MAFFNLSIYLRTRACDISEVEHFLTSFKLTKGKRDKLATYITK